MTTLKFVWLFNMTGYCQEIILSPAADNIIGLVIRFSSLHGTHLKGREKGKWKCKEVACFSHLHTPINSFPLPSWHLPHMLCPPVYKKLQVYTFWGFSMLQIWVKKREWEKQWKSYLIWMEGRMLKPVASQPRVVSTIITTIGAGLQKKFGFSINQTKVQILDYGQTMHKINPSGILFPLSPKQKGEKDCLITG